MAFGARLTTELQKVRFKSPDLIDDMTLFVKNCVNPELINNSAGMDALMKSPDVWSFIGGSTGAFSINPGRATVASGAAKTCPDAYADINTRMVSEINTQAAYLGRVMTPENSMAPTLIFSQLPSVEAYMLNVSRTAQESIKQSMVANNFIDSQATIGGMSGNPQVNQLSLAVAQAEQSSKVSYAAMAKVAEGALPKVRNAIELLIIALFPIVFILVVASGAKAGKVMGSYIMGLFWVQLWAPIYAVINFLATKNDAQQFKAVIGTSGGNTLSNMSTLAETSLSAQSIAGLLTISVPIIALAIVKGGEMAMSSAVSSLMSPAQGAAQKAGDAIGQGNVSGGNVSWGSTAMNNWSSGGFSSGVASWNSASANKDSRDSVSNSPDMAQTNSGFGGYTTEKGQLANMSVAQPSTGIQLGASTGVSAGNAMESAQSTRASQSRSAATEIFSMATGTSTTGNAYANAMAKSVNDQLGTGTSFSNTNSTDSGTNVSQSKTGNVSTGTTQQTKIQASLDAAFGLGSSGGGGGGGDAKKDAAPSKSAVADFAKEVGNRIKAGIGAGVDASMAGIVALSSMASESGSVKKDQNARMANAIITSANKQVTASLNDSATQTASQSYMAAVTNGAKSTQGSQASVTNDSSASDKQSASKDNGISASAQNNDTVMKMAVADHNGDAGAAIKSLATNSSYRNSLAQRAQAALAGSEDGKAMLANNGVQAPTSRSAVQAQGDSGVASEAAKGSGAVSSAGGNYTAKARGQQHTAPGSEPGGYRAVQQEYGATGGKIANDNSSRAGAVAYNSGLQSMAVALEGANQGGHSITSAGAAAMGMITPGGGSGRGNYSSQQYSIAVDHLANTRPDVKQMLHDISNKQAGNPSASQVQYINTLMKNMK